MKRSGLLRAAVVGTVVAVVLMAMPNLIAQAADANLLVTSPGNDTTERVSSGLALGMLLIVGSLFRARPVGRDALRSTRRTPVRRGRETQRSTHSSPPSHRGQLCDSDRSVDALLGSPAPLSRWHRTTASPSRPLTRNESLGLNESKKTSRRDPASRLTAPQQPSCRRPAHRPHPMAVHGRPLRQSG